MTTLRMLPRALLLLTLGLSQLQAFMVQQSVKHGHVPLALHPSSQTPATIENENGNGSSRRNPFAAASLAVTLTFGAMVAPCLAVSGGGLDYAGTDISGQDFSNANYKGKDFTQVLAKATKFSNSNLQGCRFYRAYLVKTNFSGADLRGAALEDTSMDDSNMKDVVAIGAYFSASINDAASLENADFTDAQFPTKTLPLLCERPDVKGTNPTTGADTRESLMCP